MSMIPKIRYIFFTIGHKSGLFCGLILTKYVIYRHISFQWHGIDQLNSSFKIPCRGYQKLGICFLQFTIGQAYVVYYFSVNMHFKGIFRFSDIASMGLILRGLTSLLFVLLTTWPSCLHWFWPDTDRKMQYFYLARWIWLFHCAIGSS